MMFVARLIVTSGLLWQALQLTFAAVVLIVAGRAPYRYRHTMGLIGNAIAHTWGRT